jgi:hypothetical protein
MAARRSCVSMIVVPMSGIAISAFSRKCRSTDGAHREGSMPGPGQSNRRGRFQSLTLHLRLTFGALRIIERVPIFSYIPCEKSPHGTHA